ncbi:MAG: hypothetical protein K2I83_00240, partial [Bacteroidales bacterium]|nr:hypothetical protein [Bacteroidales bacterium]
MKRLLYSGLMALMMFFAIGSANAQKVTIKLGTGNVPEWTLGSEDVLNFVITITEDESNTLVLGTEEGNFAVKVGFVSIDDQANWDNVIAAHTQVLTTATTPLTTTSFTEAAEYKVVYKLVKGNDNDVDFEGTFTMGNNTGFFDVVANTPDVPYTVQFMDMQQENLDETDANNVALYTPAINIMAYGEQMAPVNAEFYYVFLAEGETDVEPTRDAFEAADNTKVKQALPMTMSSMAGGMTTYAIYADDASAKTVKIKGYLSPKAEEEEEGGELLSAREGESEEFVTETYSFELAVISEKATTPVLSPANGEVEAGSTITITNFEDIADGEIWYSLNG